MKKLPFIIGIPLVAVALVLGGAMLWKLKIQTTQPTQTQFTLPAGLTSSGTKPANPFSALFGKSNPTPIPTPTPASAAAMNAELNAIGDDGGAADFISLQSDVSGL
jgi:hypothetical protein